MKKVLFICAVIMTVMLSGCGFTQHATSNENQTQTSVVLSQANYKVIGTVSGESSQLYVLGIGGLSKKSLEQAAVSDMYNNANLTGSQAIINSNVFYRAQFYLLWSKTKAIATGTIIEFEK
ncbi:MAG: hypothetical protein IKM10_06330 [Bacteroidaceae bacterium]|nr:hypothetical protein [Bacteroidaceae bacterium]